MTAAQHPKRRGPRFWITLCIASGAASFGGIYGARAVYRTGSLVLETATVMAAATAAVMAICIVAYKRCA
ncbi:hypothetical protein [Candidatus Poriferisodalis sp.]|uniref:hypothetical protein n=1 Tax=Candidatus Poriferisodalis sp. TaxID=3101277 RepID=UPI003B023B8A